MQVYWATESAQVYTNSMHAITDCAVLRCPAEDSPS